MPIKISYDPKKRAETLRERALDFEHAVGVLTRLHYHFVDDRFDYGEERCIAVGYLDGRMVVIVWTLRGDYAILFQ